MNILQNTLVALKSRRLWYAGLSVVCALSLDACATAPIYTTGPPPLEVPSQTAEVQVSEPPVLDQQPLLISPEITYGARHDVYHIVAPGETLWRLSKMYDVPMDTITCANRLGNPDELTMGQRLRIPNAAPMTPVIPLYPSRKWKYIIIHHSATDEGSALGFHFAHFKRGFNQGLGYHFVIDNGTKGKPAGNIEVSPRWLKQQDGAHCKAGGMNYNGIGICLVGNFSKERLSEKQMHALLYLVDKLRKYYGIPLSNIMGHGQVNGAHTECPGTNFPWKEFKRRLQAL
ncbi:MAG: N-acetylmuramoyl-L-alanine amidase [Candidatus Omnitrophica bacterium]|nr:N-acetylmuramoyl-L-alanine amidase [Candidatus Omnitrophota bacterium]